MLDALVGRYEFLRKSGEKATNWSRVPRVQMFIQGAFEAYPESETTFFIKINEAGLTR